MKSKDMTKLLIDSYIQDCSSLAC